MRTEENRVMRMVPSWLEGQGVGRLSCKGQGDNVSVGKAVD